MALPQIPCPTDTVIVGDEKVDVRGLTRTEAMGIHQRSSDPDKAETYILSKGLDEPLAVIENWRKEVASAAVEDIVNKILELTGLLGAATFPDDS